MFASNGYEFFGMDQRGFGHSEGIKGRVEGI
jgi:alpha-beta hydrolase superfamily lysophospholipase